MNNLLKSLVISSVLVFTFSLGGCGQPSHHHYSHKPKPQHKIVTKRVYHLSDGRYAYRDDNGVWWFYMRWTMHSSGPTYYSSSISKRPNFNSGGWLPAPINETAQIDQKAQGAQVEEEELAIDGDGQLETPEEVHEEQMEFDFENNTDNATESEGVSESSGESSSADSAGDSGASSGGDSGGGGDGGGGGGGD